MNINKILIGIDDSKYADFAAAYGFDLARSFKAHVGLVHIVEPVAMPQPANDTLVGLPLETVMFPETEILNIQKEQTAILIERTVKQYGNNVEVTNFTEYGSTEEGILRCCAEFNADMIVIGTHSRKGIDRFFMGSVAEHVVRHSTVPVLVVPYHA
jgi:nucleotide-binding universal stress UspA family protein